MGGATPSTCTPKGQAHNPLVSQIFTADPNAIVYGDRVYVYTSHDEDGQVGYKMVDYHVFSSSDLANWQDHGVIIHAKDLPWAGNLYAPGACNKNGKYYIYIPNSGSAIGVGVSDDPGGPFKDPLGKGLLTPSFPCGSASPIRWSASMASRAWPAREGSPYRAADTRCGFSGPGSST
jgi:arabinoxylan arabinofuranohydrolase